MNDLGDIMRMLPYQIRGARVLLGLNQRAIAKKLDVDVSTWSRYECVRGSCSVTACLAIRFLLVEAGLYVHFRMIYMRKDKIRPNPPHLAHVKHADTKKLTYDALAYKFDS